MNQLQQYFKTRGLTVLPDTAQWINRFEIESQTSNRVYTVAQRANLSEWGCSCMGWKRYRQCKHLKSVMPLISQASKYATHE